MIPYFCCARFSVTGTTSDSGSEVRNTYGPISVIPVAVVEVPTIGMWALVGDRANGEHLVGERRADDRNDVVTADQLAGTVDRLVLVASGVFHRQHDLAAAQHALLVDVVERQFQPGADSNAIGGIGGR